LVNGNDRGPAKRLDPDIQTLKVTDATDHRPTATHRLLPAWVTNLKHYQVSGRLTHVRLAYFYTSLARRRHCVKSLSSVDSLSSVFSSEV